MRQVQFVPEGKTYNIPTWFMGFVSIAIGLGVPWVAWASSVLWTLQVKIDDVNANATQIRAMELQHYSHAGDPGIHHGAISTLNARLDEVEKRQLERHITVERRLDQVERNQDRIPQ